MANKPTRSHDPETLRVLSAIRAALEDKKAEDIVMLDVGEKSSITNYLVLATGTSEPHLRALRIEVDRVLDETGTEILGRDAEPGSGWVVVDAFDIMVHVFLPEMRAHYQIERLWGDAAALSAEEVGASLR
ncbi:MAG: ribosome silencing factor [Verrucomicrobia bacterium]|nr:MAG: ribosome silencing factor [Verrucomicrobiota bacterium]